MNFRVWAPDAGQVQLHLNGGILPLRPDEGAPANGWWSARAEAAHGADYAFEVDGGGPLPDPRSPWQPHGVHGFSRVVEHSRFAWSDWKWEAPPLSSAVTYELHIGTFTEEGTFEAAIPRLRALVELGITHVEMMPANEFSGDRGWGYDGADLFAPHHAYGGPIALKRFVNACHEHGLAVLLDVVYNHLGPSGNYLERFGPYFSDRYTTPWGKAVNLDGPGSTEVRRFFCDNARMWLRDYHFDGLRLDAVHAIYDASAVHFLEQIASEVRELEAHLGRRLVLIAESDLNNPRLVTAREAGGYGLDAQWNDDFHHALHAALTGERTGYYGDFGLLADIAKALKNTYVYDGCESRFRKRRHGRPVRDLPGWRFLGYMQNHDQVGNRARGERSSALMSVGQLKIAAALVFCSPFLPMLFQGEEFGASTPFQYFTAHAEPDLARAVSEGRRREFEAFGWRPDDIPDPQDPETFERSKLDWGEAEREPHRELLEWHRHLIALRNRLPALTDGRLDGVSVKFCERARWLAMRRGPLLVACNFGAERQSVPVPFERGALLLSSSAAVSLGAGVLDLPPESVGILDEAEPEVI